MILRVALGVFFLVLAVEEFLRTGSAAADLVRRPGELVDAILSGDGSVGPWLLSAYGLLLIARGFGHRSARAGAGPAGGQPPVPEDRTSRDSRERDP